MNRYTRPSDREFLQRHNLATFDDIWNRRDPWFTKPNRGRSASGWSGVCLIECAGRRLFLKKQQNYFRYLPRFPFRQLLAEREIESIRLFDEHKLPSLSVVYFGVRKLGRLHQAILITEPLDDYIPLSDVPSAWQGDRQANHTKRRAVIAYVAGAIRHMHSCGLIHNSLYSKHIFIHKSLLDTGEPPRDAPPCRFIDLEAARPISILGRGAVRDLETLHRRDRHWSKADRLFFLLTYLGKTTCDAETRIAIQKFLSAHNRRKASRTSSILFGWRKKLRRAWRGRNAAN
jgi:hypothetical protein